MDSVLSKSKIMPQSIISRRKIEVKYDRTPSKCRGMVFALLCHRGLVHDKKNDLTLEKCRELESESSRPCRVKESFGQSSQKLTKCEIY